MDFEQEAVILKRELSLLMDEYERCEIEDVKNEISKDIQLLSRAIDDILN
ncbi:hypothetical protein [Bacillus sp. J33]|nr:hypothetical protein [Bacillus sp. J33]